MTIWHKQWTYMISSNGCASSTSNIHLQTSRMLAAASPDSGKDQPTYGRLPSMDVIPMHIGQSDSGQCSGIVPPAVEIGAAGAAELQG
jgi:hypothetical protein